jgi:uncharacterized damage-inducible protein DinB
MSQKDAFVRDFKSEVARTRKMLERVPLEHATYKPHEKSMALLPLAQHVAHLTSWAGVTLLQDELDFAKPMDRPAPVTSIEELLALYDKTMGEAVAAVEGTTDEILDSDWTMRNGEMVFFTRPKKEILREFVLSHLIHHRAQLGIYLRMLDVPVPAMYGPSADER